MNAQDAAGAFLTRAASPITLNLLAIGAARPLLQHLLPIFEAKTGHTVNSWFGPPVLIEKKLHAGEAVDVVFSFEPKWSDMIRAGLIDPGVEIARAGVGVAVRKGAPRPDLSTEAATKAFLLDTSQMAGAGFADGSVGSWALRAFQRMGIEQIVLPKYKIFTTGTEIINALSRGEVDAALSVMPDFADSTVVDYAGPFPLEVQQYEVARATVSAASANKQASKQLISFVRHPGHTELIGAKWLYPIN